MSKDRKQIKKPIKTDPATAKRVRSHEQFEKALDRKGLLEDDQSIRIEPEEIRHETPPGTEQMAG
jgi:poly(A) polymerase Pap1